MDSIGGANTIVEINESKFGKSKYNRNHHVEGVWVVGKVKRTNVKRIILVAVDNIIKKTLEDKISTGIKPESKYT